jgi:hypothetical protein
MGMDLRQYTENYAKWKVDLERAQFDSPPKDSREPDQRLIFNRTVKDGEISAEITPFEGQHDPNLNRPWSECEFLFRVNDEQFYIAGVGGFAHKFCIAKAINKTNWQFLKGFGAPESMNAGETYRMRVTFNSERIVLYWDDNEVLSVEDGQHVKGGCGLRTNRTFARFAKVDVTPVLPRCFVIMPFGPELDGVFNLIKEVGKANGVDCKRSDESSAAGSVMEAVKRQITSSDLIIADFSGRNANVYFEAGLADALKKKTIIIAQSAKDVTFDVQQNRRMIYTNQLGLEQDFKKKLDKAFKDNLKEESG